MPRRTTKTAPRKAKKGRNARGQFLPGYYQPCNKGARIRKAKRR